VLLLALTTTGGAALRQQETQPLDREFLVKTITCNHAEIKASELAESRATNPKVKEFAQMLVKDHKNLSERLAELAKDHKLAILAGTEKATKEMLDRLSNTGNDNFDKEYLKSVIEEHEKAIQMFDAQASRGSDSALKSFATNTLPSLRAHLTEAKKLSTDLAGK